MSDILIKELKKFNINELFFIKNNLRLGKYHLSKKIGENESNYILSNLEIPSETKAKISLSFEAKIGYFIFFYNIILTTLLGMIFGFSGLFGSGKFKIFPLVIILLLTAIISIFVTGFNIHHLKKKNSEALTDRKIAELELKIIYIILSKAENKIKKNKNKLLHISENNLKKIFSALNSNISVRFDQILKKFSYFQQTSTKESLFIKYQTQFAFKNLTRLRSYALESPLKIKKWLAHNWGDIIPTTFTTLFGSFSSSFILFNNIPPCMQESGYTFQWEKIIYSKYLLILISIIIASYFTFSHAKLMYTNYIRDYSLKKLENKTSALEMKYLHIKSQNTLLLKNLARERRLEKYIDNLISEQILINETYKHETI